jgi:spermidine synthase
MLYLLTVGLVSILSQVVILRELNVAFYGVELVYLLALGMWLLWTAAGSLLGHRPLEPPRGGIPLLLTLFCLALPLDVVFVRSARILGSGVPGAYLPFATQMIMLGLALLPPALLLGVLFQWAAKSYMGARGTLPQAYAVESLGGLAGGVIGTLSLRFGLQNLALALICSLLAAFASLLSPAGRRLRFILRWASFIASGAVLVVLWHSDEIDSITTSWNYPGLVATRDSPYGRITIVKLDGQYSIFENGVLSFDTGGTEAEEFAHLSALQHPQPEQVLILGGGVSGTVAEIARHLPRRIDYVELNPVLLRLCRQHVADLSPDYAQSDSKHILVGDPREYLDDTNESYDLILTGMPEPDSGQANRFYTREFFDQCRRRLKPGGILAFRLTSSENLWTPQLVRRSRSIYRTLRSIFPEVVVLPGSTNYFLGSGAPLCRDPELLASRLHSRKLELSLVSAPYIRYLYLNDRFEELARMLESADDPLNIDSHPICYQYTVMIWLSKFFPRAAGLDLLPHSLSEAWMGLLAGWLVLLAIFLFVRGRAGTARCLFVAVAAFTGMVLETLLLLYYQVKSGILYQDLGVLLMSFMGGLAVGAAVIDRRETVLPRFMRAPARLDVSLVAAFVLPCGFLAWQFRSGFDPGLALTAVLLSLSGLLVAAVFANAGVRHSGDPRRVIAPLYSADLIGGCIGSLVASLVLVPAFGLAATALLLIPLLAVCGLLLKPEVGRRLDQAR